MMDVKKALNNMIGDKDMDSAMNFLDSKEMNKNYVGLVGVRSANAKIFLGDRR